MNPTDLAVALIQLIETAQALAQTDLTILGAIRTEAAVRSTTTRAATRGTVANRTIGKKVRPRTTATALKASTLFASKKV